jgi:transcriptional regulator with PAS, ATPase and Fis domain
MAKAIHYNGERKLKPFLAINCGAFPETILESELFGSVRGAFTGALDKQGVFQAADGGTLFLDEIYHTSEAMQIKLLRVLQDKEIRRVGGTKTCKVDVRLICATNEDLLHAVQNKRFRQDFYYRINVITINVPPLRNRKEDIPDLAKHFLEKYSKAKKKKLKGLDKRSLQALLKYDWAENNVRELENEIERAVIYAKEGGKITPRDLSDKIVHNIPSSAAVTELIVDDKGKAMDYLTFERRYIQYVLSQVGGNKTKAARIIGIPRTTLLSKMKKLGL